MLVITVGVAALSVRRGWDLDNVSAPIVTAAGDMVTLPSLFLATYLVRHRRRHRGSSRCSVRRRRGGRARCSAFRSALPILRRIVRESLPILVVAGMIDVVAGLTIEKRFDSFLVYPALLVLVPPFLEDSGSLGGDPRRARVDEAAPRRARPVAPAAARRSATT